jgi:hypothetical protein
MGWNLLGDPNSGRPEKVMSLAFLLPKMIQCWLKRPWRRGFLWSKSGKQRIGQRLWGFPATSCATQESNGRVKISAST